MVGFALPRETSRESSRRPGMDRRRPIRNRVGGNATFLTRLLGQDAQLFETPACRQSGEDTFPRRSAARRGVLDLQRRRAQADAGQRICTPCRRVHLQKRQARARPDPLKPFSEPLPGMRGVDRSQARRRQTVRVRGHQEEEKRVPEGLALFAGARNSSRTGQAEAHGTEAGAPHGDDVRLGRQTL